LVSDPVELPIRVPSVIARFGDALVLTSERGLFVGMSTWPPQLVELDERALYVARTPTGRWLVYGRIGSTWRLRWYDKLGRAPASEQPEPVPERDFSPFAAHLDDTMRRIELAHEQRIESVHACGEQALVVPRHVGLEERRHPYVERDGAWHELTSLPPFTKTTEDLSARCCTAGVRTGDGTDLLLWDGRLFDGHTFAPRFEHKLDLSWYRSYEPVPSRDGVYACDGRELVELSSRGRCALLPGVQSSEVHRGPGDTLLVDSSRGLLWYSPAEDWVVEIPDELIGRRNKVVGVAPDGGLVVLAAGIISWRASRRATSEACRGDVRRTSR
jgi:hypothetical protein